MYPGQPNRLLPSLRRRAAVVGVSMADDKVRAGGWVAFIWVGLLETFGLDGAPREKAAGMACDAWNFSIFSRGQASISLPFFFFFFFLFWQFPLGHRFS